MLLLFYILLTAVTLFILLAIAIIDAKTMTIPNGLNLALLLCGVAAIFICPQLPLLDRFIGLLSVSLPLLIITIIAPQSFGGGDVKLMTAAGFLLGWKQVLVATGVGMLLGSLYGVYLLIAKKKSLKQHFAFGPPLCMGIAYALLIQL